MALVMGQEGGGPTVKAEEEGDEEEDRLLEGALDRLKCPISFVLMTEAVLAPDGHSYQRHALEQHMEYTKESRCYCSTRGRRGRVRR